MREKTVGNSDTPDQRQRSLDGRTIITILFCNRWVKIESQI